VIFSSLWHAAAAAAGGSLAGYRADDLVWYTIAAEAAVLALEPRLIDHVGWDIASGAIISELLRPAPVVVLRLAGELGAGLVRLALCWLVGGALGWLIAGPPRLATAALAVPATVLAAACNLAGQHAFAGVAFWLRDARAAWFLYQKLVFLLGGMLLPLELLPGPVTQVARLLPLASMAYVPARLASGHLEPWLLALQAGWLAALLALAVTVFALGERRVAEVGA
jgi:ABC-2 type transport system permease protein